jgi:hypothetical protein
VQDGSWSSGLVSLLQECGKLPVKSYVTYRIGKVSKGKQVKQLLMHMVIVETANAHQQLSTRKNKQRNLLTSNPHSTYLFTN